MLSIVVPENQLKGSYSKVLLVYTFGIARDSIALMEDTIFPFYFLSRQVCNSREQASKGGGEDPPCMDPRLSSVSVLGAVSKVSLSF